MVVAAMENPHKAGRGPTPAMQRLLAEMAAKPQKPVRKELVWSGSDIDGDGRPTSPTRPAARRAATTSSATAGSAPAATATPRDHEGVDYVAKAGQDVLAPISGYVTKIGYAYAGSSDLKFVEINNPALGYVARAFYVTPASRSAGRCRLGEVIGTDQSLQSTIRGSPTTCTWR